MFNLFKKNISKHTKVINSIAELVDNYRFKNNFVIIETDLDQVRSKEDLYGRRRLDAEILSIIASNVQEGVMLDIGTCYGNSAARMAVNSPKSMVYTVNIHPDRIDNAGKLTTIAPSIDEIGSFYRKHKIVNIVQLYENTKEWIIPDEINNISLAYIDGCHDCEYVYSDSKKIFPRIKKGGFILWHDFSPIYQSEFDWINSAMKGVEKFITEDKVEGKIINIKNSWVGILQKL